MNIIERYERELKVIKGKSDLTVSAYLSDVTNFKEYVTKKVFTGIEFDEALKTKINYEVLEDYTYHLIDLGFKKSTINRNINSLKSFFKYTSRYTNNNPCENLSVMSNVETKKKDLLSKEQILSLIEQAKKREGRQLYFDFISKRNCFIISLLATTGLRIQELLTIKKRNVIDFGEYARVKIDIHSNTTKMNKVIVIAGVSYKYYKEYIKEYEKKFTLNDDSYIILSGTGNKVATKDINKMLKKYSEAVGIEENVSCHVFRMFCNIQLLSLNCSDTIRNKILGWADGKVGSNNYFKDDSIEADRMKINYIEKILG